MITPSEEVRRLLPADDDVATAIMNEILTEALQPPRPEMQAEIELGRQHDLHRSH